MVRTPSRIGLWITAGFLLVVFVPGTAAAQSVTGELIQQLNRQLLYVAVPIAVLVEFLLFYTVWRFSGTDEPTETHKNRPLELSWTVATALILLFVGTASFAVLASPFVSAAPVSHSHADGHANQPGEAPPEAVEVVVEARQWGFTFYYPDHNITSETLVLPTDRPVYIYTTSTDVIHSFHVPALGLKQDAFPGQYKLLRTSITDQGTYRLYCAEFCGEGHATMKSEVRAVSPDAYTTWTQEHSNSTVTGGPGTQENQQPITTTEEA